MNVIDLTIVSAYLLLNVVVGIACRGRQQDTQDYFAAGGTMIGRFGTLLVGLSIAATLFSGISLLSYPSIVYTHGPRILIGAVCFPLAWVILRFWFLPRFLDGKSKHPYDKIEQTFGPSVRTTASVMFILLRIGWMAALIYAPTLILMAAAGLGEEWFWPLVLAIGLSCTIYTTIGGIRGVIVTDAIQFVIIAAGLSFVIGYIFINLPVPLAQVFSDLREDGRLDVFDFSLSPTEPFTVWTLVIGFTVVNLASYLADQMSLQRYLATGTVRSASRSFGFNVCAVIALVLLLSGVGLMLAAWYRYLPDPGLPEAADQVFPYFVASHLPVGISGLLLAAILAATMSSMTSGINALSGSLTEDFRARMSKRPGERELLSFARGSSLAIGLVATLLAGWADRLGTIFDISQILLGVFLGPLLVCMVLSIAEAALRPSMVLAGMILGCVAGWAVAWSPMAPLWVSVVAALVTLLVAASGGSRPSVGPK